MATDVVVGFVETHGRRHDGGAGRRPRGDPAPALEYRDSAFDEMDLDAVLARRPEVALVDELAHTNVPGSRNEKRWQDVEELLDAGIDVISTLNIQHLESLNDVVEQITGDQAARDDPRRGRAARRPDRAGRPRRRGAPPRASRTATSTRQSGSTLRSATTSGPATSARSASSPCSGSPTASTRACADYRARHGIEQPWETRERVLVALTGVGRAASI